MSCRGKAIAAQKGSECQMDTGPPELCQLLLLWAASQSPLAGQSHHSSNNWKWFLGVRDKKRLLRGRELEREHYSYQIHGTWGTCLDSQPSYFYTIFFTALGRYWHKEKSST